MEYLTTQWVKFLFFCFNYGLQGLPASGLILAWYAQFLSYSFKSYNSVVNYLCGVKSLHKILNLPTSGFIDFNLKLTLRGLKRTMNSPIKQALPITPVLLNGIYDVIDHSNPLDVTFWAACLVGFFLLFRKSNLMPTTLSSFDFNKKLCRQDLKWKRDRVLVTLRWSKTNQFGDHEVFSLPRIPGSKMCPYTALNNMIKLNPGSRGICFKRPDGKPMIYSFFQNKLRKCLTILKQPALLFSSHSFRRGGTTFAFLCGVPTELIKTLGGWKSDCYLRYIQFPLEARTAAADLIKFRIQQLKG